MQRKILENRIFELSALEQELIQSYAFNQTDMAPNLTLDDDTRNAQYHTMYYRVLCSIGC